MTQLIARRTQNTRPQHQVLIARTLGQLDRAYEARALEYKGQGIVANALRETDSKAAQRLVQWALRREGYAKYIPTFSA